jgi:hypothetical protein
MRKIKIQKQFFDQVKNCEYDICKQLNLTLPEFYNKVSNGNLNVFEIVTVLHYMDLNFESFIQYYDWG